MATIDYSVSVSSPAGAHQAHIPFNYLTLTRSCNDFGALLINTTDKRFLDRNYRFNVWRSIDRAAPQRVTDTSFLLRKVSKKYVNNHWSYDILAFSPLYLLSKRIVAAYAASSGASKSGPAGTMIRTIISDAFTTNAWATMYRSSPTIVLPASYGLGATIEKQFAWRNVLAVCQEIADTSYQAGNPLYFDITDDIDTGALSLTIKDGQLGTDRSYGVSGSSLIFSPERGNVRDIVLVRDYSNEPAAVYAGGEGKETNRQIAYLVDPAIASIDSLNYSEVFVDARNSTSTSLQSEARARLREQAMKPVFTATLLSTLNSQFMVNWFWGDKITVYADGEEFSCRVENLKLDYRNREEKIEARIVA